MSSNPFDVSPLNGMADARSANGQTAAIMVVPMSPMREKYLIDTREDGS